MHRSRWIRFGALLLALLQGACSSTTWRAEFAPVEERQSLARRYRDSYQEQPYLKIHLNDGRLYVLEDWKLDEDWSCVHGKGLEYAANRLGSRPGHFRVPYDQIALLETNRPETVTHSGLIVMGVVAGASLLVTAMCIANPKACFGSCPTFYAHDGQVMTIQAEGFSASIARALEATDVDPLYSAQPQPGPFELLMTNEALETHAVRSVRLLSVPRPDRGRVLHADDSFYAVSALTPPAQCQSLSGDCLGLVSATDGQEYQSLTDEHDLAAQETLELAFPEARGKPGLVIVGRMGLLTTYLLYQALAYLGHSAGEWLVKLERGDRQIVDSARAMHALLGEVEVRVLTRQRGWVKAGAFYEMGPIAREAQLIELPRDLPEGEVRVRLRMTRGNWKLDEVALVSIGEAVEPEFHEVRRVLRGGQDDPVAWARLRDADRYLVTYPGDAYTLRFELPEGDRELFLESRGYYYEWIRSQWLAEKDPSQIARFLLDPKGTLRRLAPQYKRIEGSMDRIFWQSRIGRRP